MPSERFRTVHLAADRRRPFGHIGERRPETVKLTPNQVALRVIVGIVGGVLLTLAMTGQPW